MKRLNATEMRKVEGGKYKCVSCSYTTWSLIAISWHTLATCPGMGGGYTGSWGW